MGVRDRWKELEREAIQEGQVAGQPREVVRENQDTDRDYKNAADNFHRMEMLFEPTIKRQKTV